jgi:hypothetical protein
MELLPNDSQILRAIARPVESEIANTKYFFGNS